MKVKYTPEQEAVINLRDCNLLVSAAAGSGKTAVLTQRIIERLCDAQNPISIDRILIVTFTQAAAAEMRERIASALHDKIAECPTDTRLKKQITLLHNAQITTIDSFCLYLLKNHFHDINLDPAFQMIDENGVKLLMDETMDELFADKITSPDEGFLAFVEAFTNGWDLKNAKEKILQIYKFSQSHPFPEEWLQECAESILDADEAHFAELPWKEMLTEYEKMVLDESIAYIREALRICDLPDGPSQYRPALESDMSFYVSLQEQTDERAKYVMLSEVSFVRLSNKKNPEQTEENKEAVKELRANAKSLLEDLQNTLYYAEPEAIKQEYFESTKLLYYMLRITLEFLTALNEKKQEKNVIDFSDMEHKALKILLQKENGVYVPTEVAKSYQEYFQEVMVDEYQDSNAVQELLLESISRQSETFGNRFMVGDVKQSIYRFRLAKPEIFMEKYETYDKSGGVKRRIDLSKNFRSRKEVVDSVNAVFEKLMIKEVGAISYDEDAKLYLGAEYPDTPMQEQRAQLLYFDKKKMKESVSAGIIPEYSNVELEAYMIAKRIRELHGRFLVTDKKTKELRPARYSDMVILLRVASGVDDVFKKILTQENIPTHITSRSGYFKTAEIHLLLDYLTLVNNPRQDIPLLSVLHSYLGGFSEEEIARIRIAGTKEELLYDSLVRYGRYEMTQASESDKERECLTEKVAAFLTQIDVFREKAVYMGIFELLEGIVRHFDYENHVALLPDGEQQRANVRLLLQKAKAFEGTGYAGVFHFVRYIENMKEKEIDFGEANVLAEDADVVRIMTIHKSKGLEFPICFVSGLAKQFRKTDYSDSLLCDDTFGVAVDYFDRVSRRVSTTLYKNAIAVKKRMDARGEDMRILYVALTRAKEKLFLTGFVNDSEKMYAKQSFSQSELLKANSFMSLCVPVVLSEPECFVCDEFLPEELLSAQNKEEVRQFLKKEYLLGLTPKNIFATYQYPHVSLEGLFTKTTVSELKKDSYEEALEASASLYRGEEDTEYIPSFISATQEGGGTRRGSAYHRVMELLDYAAFLETQDISAEYDRQFERMCTSGMLSKEWSELVDRKKVIAFLQNPLAKRMGAAMKEGRLYCEQPFVLGIEASLLDSGFPQQEQVLIQGVIDAYFEENGTLVLLDYKTDRVKEGAELINRYATQLDYYAQALTRLTHKPVSAKILYSFALQETVQIYDVIKH